MTAEYLGFGQSFALSVSNVFGFLGLNRTVLSDEIKTLIENLFADSIKAIDGVFRCRRRDGSECRTFRLILCQ